MRFPRWTRVALPLASLSVLSCSLIDKLTGKGNGDDEIDPTATEAMLRRDLTTTIPALTGALARVLATVNGSPQPGVTFVAITGGVQGTVSADLDGNGVMESSVDAKLIFNNPAVGIAGGAKLTVTSINSPVTTGTATSDIALSGSSTVIYSNGQATLHPSEGPSTLTVSNANFSATASYTNPVLSGSADFGSPKNTGKIFFEPAGSSFQMRVTSPDFATFIVP